MKLLRDQEAPPHFDGVLKAFAMARNLPASQNLALQVGLVVDGELFSVGQLDGYRQVSFLSDYLRDRGWQEHLLGGDADMHGCDMLFSLPVDAEQKLSLAKSAQSRSVEDPSFIRRTPVELWPLRETRISER
jgi:hypothetical protein